jgi:O-antigen/teichoic acid export membrane protein
VVWVLNLRSRIGWLRGIIRTEMGLVYTTVGNTGSSFLGGLFWLVLASLLQVESYGLVNYYIALGSVFSAVALTGLDATVITYMAKGEKHINYQANSLVLLSGLSVGLVLSVFQLGSGLLAVAMVFFMMAIAETLGRKRYREYAFLSIGQRVVQISLSLFLYFQFGIMGIVIGYFLGNLIFSYRYIKSMSNFTLKVDSVKEKRNFTLHSYGFNLIRNFTNYLDKIIIGPLFGYFVLGLYQLGFQFFLFLSIIPMSLYYYLLPEESSGNDKTKIKQIGFGLAVAAAVIAFFTLPYFIEILFPSFVSSILVVRIMSLAVIPSTIVAVMNASLLGRGRSRMVLIAGLIYLVSLMVGVIALGGALGAIGLALTLVVAQSIQATVLLAKRKVLG